ncbi:lantibiotic dehydratase [Streptomyces sp. 891-h]|uniref:lantibiotic dehydratase n=1 Tax=Streptomyces sp. 891-h TaxID=2720714 RepID=UPI001FAAF4F1|nr:lantibiotic dehydratase [Streptomyces sp. 891-h]UNZ21268.1 lantibiotic dehydratase [Streptomyces sp. 891-h]
MIHSNKADGVADDAPDPIFRAAGFGVVRMAALPSTHPSALHTRAEAVGAEESGDGEASRLVRYIRDLVADPVVREAIEVSSGSLAGTLARLERDEAPLPVAKLRRAALAVTRYVLRMSGRPTPFGLLAGVGTVRFGGEAAVRIGSAHRKSVRPDAGWLDEIAGRLHHEARVRDGLYVVANNLCAVRGDRLALSYVRAPRGAPPSEHSAVPHEMTVGYGPVVRAAVEAAHEPLTFAALRTAVRDRFPEARPEDVERLLVQLIDRDVLLTDVAARQDRPDLLGYVNARLSEAEPAAPAEGFDVRAGLRRVEELLSAYAVAAPGSGREAWREAVGAMREIRRAANSAGPGSGTGAGAGAGAGPSDTRPPVHVDLRTDSDIRLPDAVIEEVVRAAGVLWRLAPAEGQHPHLSEYHRAFLDRYGTDRPVAVREVLDPQLGLGAPADYRVPASDRSCGPAPAVPYPTARDEALGQAVHEVLASGAGPEAELVLDEALLARLAPEDPEDAGARRSPGTLDLCVQPLARSLAALAAGDFRLLVANGSYSAGAMAGRFAHTLGIERELTELYEDEDEAPLPVQLFFQPRHARSSNVARVPRVAGHAVAVGCFPDPGDGPQKRISVDDLAVGATRERLFLVHASTGREISVLRPNMLNLATEAPNMARFLAGVGMSGSRPWAPWQWSRLEALPCLPRVRYGRTVLAPARWRPPPELRDRALDEKDWLRTLESWRSRCRVPDVLRVSVLDHHLDLDMTATAHQQLLRAQLTSGSAPLVQESPLVDPAGLGWSEGYVTEVVVPLLPTRPRPAVPRAPRPATSRVRHAPGGEWLYAKVYAARDRLDTLLVRDLPPLLERVEQDVDRWFFLRYLDPGPHLRLRLHGAPETIRSHVLPALHQWAGTAADEGLIRKVVLDTYEPETERYGGPEALVAAERLFHADSRLVTAQLAARARGGLPMPLETLAALNHAALLGSLGDWDWWSWVLAAYPMDVQNEIPANRRRAAVRLADEYADESAGGGELTAEREALAQAAREYGRALGIGTARGPSPERAGAVAGVLHMHANRLLGMDAAAERHSYGILRSLVRTFAGRKGHV